ncbi:MAG: CBS domain-containing protein [Acidobacteria bacterium]|jgi:CBS domain-containing protein|nr:MAG: CBS domain-containing protein [Acidobacteriota bacterium]
MKEIDLSELTTGIPKIEYDLSILEGLKTFEEHLIYDLLVVVKENRPVGVIRKIDLIRAQSREGLTVGDLARPLMKLRISTVKPQQLTTLLDFFNSFKSPIILVDRKGSYIGLLFYEVVLHYINMFKETTVPIFQKLRSLFRQPYFLYGFYMSGLEHFRDMLGSSKEESLIKILYEDIKSDIEGETGLSYEDREVYVLSKYKLSEERVKEIYEEFHKEFSLLYAEIKPVYVHGYCISLQEVKDFEEFFKLRAELKSRLDSIQDASFFIFHGEKPSVVLCEYKRREFIFKIRERIKEDFQRIAERLKENDMDIWEFLLYDFFKEYPYFELFYVMNERGLQISNNVINPKKNYPIKTGRKGADRSEREYFRKASHEDVYLSPIYISQATDDFCITVSKKFNYAGKSYVLAGDINYREIHNLVKSYAEETLTNR